MTVSSGKRILGRSGGLDPAKGNEVDRWAHYVNVFMLDKDGNRINRRNPQLYLADVLARNRVRC